MFPLSPLCLTLISQSAFFLLLLGCLLSVFSTSLVSFYKACWILFTCSVKNLLASARSLFALLKSSMDLLSAMAALSKLSNALPISMALFAWVYPLVRIFYRIFPQKVREKVWWKEEVRHGSETRVKYSMALTSQGSVVDLFIMQLLDYWCWCSNFDFGSCATKEWKMSFPLWISINDIMIFWSSCS